ncbi:unannotated protein [freshwater metagenome]|uniref:Unannotated protein n=1 Tax=freshwater metagenome TaxID=449393 RepID=A0A6J7L0T1_9ZZZZ
MSTRESGVLTVAPKQAHGAVIPARTRPTRKVVKNARVTSAKIAPTAGTTSSRVTSANSASGTIRVNTPGRGRPSSVNCLRVAGRSRSFAIAAVANSAASTTAAQ